MSPLPASIEKRIHPEPNTGCWFWMGQVNQEGYGRTRLADRSSMVAHRVVFQIHNDITIPGDMQLDHLCRVRCCVNPDHLEIVTAKENTRRAITGKHGTVARAECAHGHPMKGDNIWRRKHSGSEIDVCRECARQYRARYRRTTLTLPHLTRE